MYSLRVSCLACFTLRVVSQPSTTMSACFQFCRSASMTAARFFPPDWRCCWINQPIILLSLTPPCTPHGTCRPVAGLNLHPASHLRMPTLAQDAPAGRISQVTASDTLVIRLVFPFLGLHPGLAKNGSALRWRTKLLAFSLSKDHALHLLL